MRSKPKRESRFITGTASNTPITLLLLWLAVAHSFTCHDNPNPFSLGGRGLEVGLWESTILAPARHVFHNRGGSSPSKWGSYPAKTMLSRRSASRRTSPGTRLRSAIRKSVKPFTASTTAR